MLTPAFLRRLDRLDRQGLEALRGELVGRQEVARVRFGRSRSVRDGDSYRRRGHELGEVRSRLRQLEARGE
jgi:hypothetical protein